MEKRSIYIIQMYSRTIPSKLIKFFTKYKYCHIGICLNKNCDTIYSFGRRGLYNIFNGGFTIEQKAGKFFKRFNKTICRIYELEISQKQYLQIEEQLNYMEVNQKIYKYDFFGLFLRMFNIPVSFKNSYVCSQFIAKLLEDFNIYKFKKEVCFIKPKDFEMVDGIKEIYSGNYLSY